MTVARSTPATPSTSAWWVLEISAKRLRSSPCTSHSSHSGFERSSRCECTRAVSARSCSSEPGEGSAVWRTWYCEVERAVVDPQRAAGLQRRERELLPVARRQVQPAADLVAEVLVVRRRALEDEQRADVHVGVLDLLGQEGRVDGREPVSVGLRHRRAAYPAQMSAVARPVATAATRIPVSTGSYPPLSARRRNSGRPGDVREHHHGHEHGHQPAARDGARRAGHDEREHPDHAQPELADGERVAEALGLVAAAEHVHAAAAARSCWSTSRARRR